jgi:DNA-binding NtrC family response regulator
MMAAKLEHYFASEQSFDDKIASFKEMAKSLVADIDAAREARILNIHQGINLPEEVINYEVSIIRRALRATGGNQKEAARLLGLRVTTLNSKIRRHKIRI